MRADRGSPSPLRSAAGLPRVRVMFIAKCGGRAIGCGYSRNRPKSGARDPINQSLKPTSKQIESRSLHPPDHQPWQILPGSKSGSIIFRSETEQVSVTANRCAYAG
jgi:hypothetical protein